MHLTSSHRLCWRAPRLTMPTLWRFGGLGLGAGLMCLLAPEKSCPLGLWLLGYIRLDAGLGYLLGPQSGPQRHAQTPWTWASRLVRLEKVESGYLSKGRSEGIALITQRKIVSDERHQSCGLLHRERGLTARTLKVSWANTPILESVNNMFRKTMGASVMLREARKGVYDCASL
jgi:hypothetical protein